MLLESFTERCRMMLLAIKQILPWLSSNPVLVVATVVCLYVASIAVYRLYLSPLAGIPGPKLAGEYKLTFQGQTEMEAGLELYRGRALVT
jgi:hypothetical protein